MEEYLFPWTPTGQTFQGLSWIPSAGKPNPPPCRACGHTSKVYPRGISNVIGRALIRLYGMDSADPDKQWHHIKDIYRDRGDFAKLKFFGLIEERVNLVACKKTSGFWKITQSGRSFVLNQSKVPKYALVAPRSTLVGFAGDPITIRECVKGKSKFCYEELMRGPGFIHSQQSTQG